MTIPLKTKTLRRVREISLVDRGAGDGVRVMLTKRHIAPDERGVSLPLEIKKVDADRQLVFGWASVVEKNGQVVIDKQGDIIPVEELETAAYDFMLNGGDGGDMHERPGVAKMIESIVFTKEKQQALGIDIGLVGWWVGFKVTDADLWKAIKSGDRPEFSIGGSAVPEYIEQEITMKIQKYLRKKHGAVKLAKRIVEDGAEVSEADFWRRS
jgi:hypothetical protein